MGGSHTSNGGCKAFVKKRRELNLRQSGDGATTETRIFVCQSRQTQESRTPYETAHIACGFWRTSITLQTGWRSHPIETGQASCTDLFSILTPVWWILMLILINLLAELFPSTSPDSTFVFVTWGVMTLIFTATVTYTGVQQGRLIREYEAQRGLWLARGAVTVGALFTVATLAIIVAIFTSGDASTRPLL